MLTPSVIDEITYIRDILGKKPEYRRVSEKVANSPEDDSSERMVSTLQGLSLKTCYIGGVLIFALLFSAAGAYDTDKVEFLHRFAIWTTLGALLILQTVVSFRVLKAIPRPLRMAIISVMMTVVVALEVEFLKYVGFIPHEPDPIVSLIFFLLPIILPLTFVILLIELFHSTKPKAADRQILDEASFNWSSNNVAWVHASDHYLEIGLSSGETRFVRGRIMDAAKHLSSIGLQVHRSWWVARSEVEKIETQGRDRVIWTKQDKKIPIGRSRIKLLKSEKWL
ncbi:LytTR family DNA-binding domain-containing protein [Hirschia maritima]|uniref:LytTR family DNA-binding domain-containing protein n=1 Tax=Hirschia maritima TaxID=1121961 RepID=UPI0009DA8D88|nr:LytTR family transcriptional regulator DNA-binding domain-containing protein [Hirschia maritima]